MTLDKAQRRVRLRYLAVCGKQTSYALDYYPNERARYLREFGREVIRDCAIHDDAFDAAFAELRRRARRRTIAGVLERFRANGNPDAREIEAGSA